MNTKNELPPLIFSCGCEYAWDDYDAQSYLDYRICKQQRNRCMDDWEISNDDTDEGSFDCEKCEIEKNEDYEY